MESQGLPTSELEQGGAPNDAKPDNDKVDNDIIYRMTVDSDLADDCCTVCQEEFKIGDDDVVTLRCECRYYYHEKCLAFWIRNGDGCPACRIHFYDLDIKYILASAASRGDIDKVRQLLEDGAPHSPRGVLGSTPLIDAASKGHESIIALLSDRGASVSDKRTDGRTALHLAAANGYEKAVTLLVDRGADMSARDGEGSTPLHHAVKKLRHNMVRCLIELGAPCSTPDKYGLTPLDMARDKGVIASTELLEERGAKTRVDLIIEMSGQ